VHRWAKVLFVALSIAVGLVGVGGRAAHAAANPFPHTAVSGFSTPDGQGFWLTYSDGAISTNGNAANRGDASQLALKGPMVGGAVAAGGGGYWLVANDGGIFSYGSARFFGSMGAARLNQPVFSMAATKSGKGYWLVARDGGIFTFGDGHFYGSTGAITLNQPIIGITTSPTGKGYRMVARDGGIFSFGDVPFYGSLPSRGMHATNAVGMAPSPSGKGYWIARADGTVDSFGDAPYLGNYTPSVCDAVAAIFANPKQPGYRLLLQSGATVAFFQGAPGGGRETGAPRQCPPGVGGGGVTGFTGVNFRSVACTPIDDSHVRWSLRYDTNDGVTKFIGPFVQKFGTTKTVPVNIPGLAASVTMKVTGHADPGVITFGCDYT
jgi:hypothetical protein